MAELFKFRCSECQKLLGISPRKVGRMIHCPQCGAELIVPSPDEAPTETEEATEFADLGIDLGFASPLDLRLPELPTDRLIDQPGAIEEAIAFLERSTAPPPFEPPGSALEPSEVSTKDLTAAITSVYSDADADAELDLDDEPEPLVQTALEPLQTSSARQRSRPVEATVDRRRDVVLPRTAAVAWALFAILALGFSFLSGLMIGHYRWR